MYCPPVQRMLQRCPPLLSGSDNPGLRCRTSAPTAPAPATARRRSKWLQPRLLHFSKQVIKFHLRQVQILDLDVPDNARLQLLQLQLLGVRHGHAGLLLPRQGFQFLIEVAKKPRRFGVGCNEPLSLFVAGNGRMASQQIAQFSSSGQDFSGISRHEIPLIGPALYSRNVTHPNGPILQPSRYDRQARLPQVGPEGQAEIRASTVVVVGCGALGCVAIDHLARAGVGTLRLIDRDIVDFTNLQRQSLYTEADAAAALPKAEAAAARVSQINSEINIQPRAEELNSESIDRLLGGATVLIDGTDNPRTRGLLNDWSVKSGTPWVYGGVVGTAGRSMGIRPGVGPCLACAFGRLPSAGELETCETAGVLGPLVGMVASVQAATVIELLTAQPNKADTATMVVLEALPIRMSQLAIDRDAACPVCVGLRFDYLHGPAPDDAKMCGQNVWQFKLGRTLDLPVMAARWQRAGLQVVATRLMVRGRSGAEHWHFSAFADGRVLVSGFADREKSANIMARYVSV